MIESRAMTYQGYGNCARCGDRWPILFVRNEPRPLDADEWLVADGYVSEAKHDIRHESIAGRIANMVHLLRRRFGFERASW